MDLARHFGPGGTFERSLEGWRVRPQQLEFAQAVLGAIESAGILIAEAGTGTGKTFAYLAPALVAGGRVIVSTGTKTLQDQLFHRDLPLVREAMGVPAKIALLKGRANYVCLHHLEESAAEGTFASREEARDIHAIARFAGRTDTGDKAECLQVPELSGAWARATSTRENCLGSKCRHYEDCFVMKARKAASDADLVVVNHHLFFADVVLRDEGVTDLLPSANTVIFDEAHHLPDLARLFFGQSVSTAQVVELARDARGAQILHAKETPAIGEAALAADRAARDVRIALGTGTGRYASAQLDANAELARALDALDERLGALGEILAAHAERADELRNAHARALELRAAVAAWRGEAGEGAVRWVEAYSHSAVLNRTPLDVAPIFAQQISGAKRAWIFTSATLSVGGDFAHYQSELGLAQAATHYWESPYDFANQALLYVPEGLPDPNSPGYTEAVIDAAFPVIEAAGGRAFLLFTSLRAMDTGHARLREKLAAAGLDWPLYLQGTAGKNELLDRFRDTPNAILLGSQSFWEGVDVKGEALSLVVIDKLPFNPPDDPVLAARIEQINRAGGNAFMQYQVPRAVIALKQGAGRLIRDETDRGVLMICDPRLVSKSYGKRIWRALPPFRRTRSREEAVAFFRGAG
ncbi:MAG: ATP-dependent DNA helicase [Betaproteobacteria bacterium]|nr:ATP-dependent DNA helicase [Betaproteobacteria bacterium]PWB58045.1 MAG: helicase [Betaproteobacteria bacterium]